MKNFAAMHPPRQESKNEQLVQAPEVCGDRSSANNGEVSFVVEIESALEGAGSFDVHVTLPRGFRYVPDSLTYDGRIIFLDRETEELQQKNPAAHGYEIEEHSLVLYVRKKSAK